MVVVGVRARSYCCLGLSPQPLPLLPFLAGPVPTMSQPASLFGLGRGLGPGLQGRAGQSPESLPLAQGQACLMGTWPWAGPVCQQASDTLMGKQE